MKSPTAHLQELEQNIKSANILLESMPSGEIKADIDHLKIKAFVLLIHAALETYFEELGISAVKAARIKLKKGTISASLVSLITTSVLAEINEKSKKSIAEDLVKNLNLFSEHASNRYINVVFNNNGIKLKNLKELLLPIGVDPESVDLALCNNLNAFGILRGEIAHKFKGIKTEHTKSSITQKVNAIQTSIADLDKAVCLALKKSMTT